MLSFDLDLTSYVRDGRAARKHLRQSFAEHGVESHVEEEIDGVIDELENARHLREDVHEVLAEHVAIEHAHVLEVGVDEVGQHEDHVGRVHAHQHGRHSGERVALVGGRRQLGSGPPLSQQGEADDGGEEDEDKHGHPRDQCRPQQQADLPLELLGRVRIGRPAHGGD